MLPSGTRAGPSPSLATELLPRRSLVVSPVTVAAVLAADGPWQPGTEARTFHAALQHRSRVRRCHLRQPAAAAQRAEELGRPADGRSLSPRKRNLSTSSTPARRRCRPPKRHRSAASDSSPGNRLSAMRCPGVAGTLAPLVGRPLPYWPEDRPRQIKPPPWGQVEPTRPAIFPDYRPSERVVPTRAELDDLGERYVTTGQRPARSDSAICVPMSICRNTGLVDLAEHGLLQDHE
jgi:hypothetical protein